VVHPSTTFRIYGPTAALPVEHHHRQDARHDSHKVDVAALVGARSMCDRCRGRIAGVLNRARQADEADRNQPTKTVSSNDVASTA
jgi:hypothetical protein